MPREINGTTETTLAGTIVPIAVLVEITLTTGPLYVWSGLGNLAYGGNTYQGVGKLGKISVIEETNSVYATGVTLTLEGVDSADLADALTELPIGMPIVISFAVMSGPAVVGAPVVVFSGNSDQISISENVSGATIAIDVESKLAQLQRNREYRYTDQMQRYLHPNDSGLQFVNLLTNYLGTWGFALGDQS